MKKIFLILAALFASAMMMAAETTVNIIDAAGITASVSLNAENNPYKMGETPITLTGTKGTSNFPALNYNSSNGTDLRFYNGTTCGVTFEADGNIITKIEFLKSTNTASDLGDAFSVDEGTLTGNIWEGMATSVTLTYSSTANYKEQMYIINVTYISSTPQKELISMELGGEATKLSYFVGESFDPAGLTVTGTYSDASTDDVTSKVAWTIEPETFTEASDNASVTLSASYNDMTTDEITITGINVKPAMININAKNAILNNNIVAGFWIISGQTEDEDNSFNIYFNGKALQGTFTDVEQFDTYSTWVSDKSTGSNVYYETLSAVNLTSVIDGDSLKITGTMNLTDYNGNEAIVTIYITTPFTQTWGEWEDFAPFDKNTGKYTFTAMFDSPQTQTNIPIQVRKDNTGMKQFKFIGWGKQIYTSNGIDLLVDMAPDYTCTVPQQDLGADLFGYGENVQVQDYASRSGQPYLSTYDPETGEFEIALSYFISLGSFGSDYETMIMDKPILERDTVDIVSTKLQYNDLIASYNLVIYYVSDVPNYYLFRVTSDNATAVDGTFKWSDGTINNPNSYFSVSGTDKNYFQDGEFTVVTTDAGTSLTGWMIGADEKYYRLNLSKKNGVLDYDTDAPFEAEFSYYDMEASIENGVISIHATNAENLTISLELYTDPAATKIPAGTYVISDSQEAGTALKSVGLLGSFLSESWAGVRAASGGINDCWFLVEGTITLSYDEYGKLKVVVDGTNSWEQPVEATIEYEKLDPKETVEINNAEFYVSDDLGVMKFYGSNDNNKFDLYVNTETTTGDFTDAIDFGDCKIFIADGSSISVIDEYEFKVEANGKNLTLTAKLLGSDTIQYNITATGYLGALEYDAKEIYNGKFAIEEVTLTQTDTLVNIIGINAAGDSVNVIVEGELVGGVLAPGEYTNIVASPGFYNFNFTPSFVLNEDAIWFIQSGKLTVADNGSMTFEGINSYDKNVTITIGSVTAGITVNVGVPAGTPACYFYGEMSGNTFAEMTKLDDTHYTIDFPDATTIGWGYKFVWEAGNWSTANSDPEGDFSVEPVNGVIDVEVRAWATAPAPAPAEYKYTEYENWQLKPEGSDWSDNLIKVEDGLFKLVDVNWTGSGFNIKSDENPIKKDFFSVEELVIAEECIAPVIVDVYLKVIDDETLAIEVRPVPTDAINIINAEDTPNGAIIKGGKVYIIRDGKIYNLQGSEIKNAGQILKSLNF